VGTLLEGGGECTAEASGVELALLADQDEVTSSLPPAFCTSRLPIVVDCAADEFGDAASTTIGSSGK